MFFPAFSTVSYVTAKGSFRLPFFRPGDLLCYVTGTRPSFYVIEEATLDYIITTNKIHFSSQVNLLALRKEHLDAADLGLFCALKFGAQDLFSVQPSLGSLSEYLQLCSSLSSLRATRATATR